MFEVVTYVPDGVVAFEGVDEGFVNSIMFLADEFPAESTFECIS
jgi:hypothetical protein